jgi:hypothetical protein
VPQPSSLRSRVAAVAAVGLALLGAPALPAQAEVSPPCPAVERIPVAPSGSSDVAVSDTATSELGEDAEGSILGKLAGQLLDEVIAGVGGDIGGDVAGWIIGSLSAPPDSTPTPVQQEELDKLNGLSSDLQALQSQVAALSTQISSVEQELISVTEAAQAYSTYQQQATALSDGALSSMVADIQNVCEIANEQYDAAAAAGETTALTEDQTTQLETIVTDNSEYIDAMNAALVGDGNSAGLIEVYSRVLWLAEGSADTMPSGTLISSGLLSEMQTIVQFYASVATLHLEAFIEAVHALPGYTNDQPIYEYYVNSYVPYIQQWSYLAGMNLPALDPALIADVSAVASPNPGTATTPGTIRVWTAVPAQIAGQSQSRYCMQQGMCVAPDYYPETTGSSPIAVSVVPAVAPLSSYLNAPQYGLSGWRVPTVADWASLTVARDSIIPSVPGEPTPAPPTPATGVAAWAGVEGLPVLETADVPYPTGSIASIPPLVVDDPVEQALIFNGSTFTGDPAGIAAYDAGYTFGGQLALVQDIAVAPPVLPTYPSSATATAASAPVSHAASAATAASSTTLAADAGVGSTWDATTYDTPVACTDQDDQYVQPAGANAVQVTVAAGAGGVASGGGPYSVNIPGGLGAQLTATIPVAAGTVLYVGVGGRGGDWNSLPDGEGAPGGIGNGGPGGDANQDNQGDTLGYTGAGGGGLSQITLDAGCRMPIAVAGGGGGAGMGIYPKYVPIGGNGCMSTGCTGVVVGTSNQEGTLTTGGSEGGNYQAGPLSGLGAVPSGTAGGAGGAVGVQLSGFGEPSYGGGAGGGGGGGFTGGGGGGGTTSSTADDGGGGEFVTSGPGSGGSSFLAAGSVDTSLALNTAQDGQGFVTITPLVVPEYTFAVYSPGARQVSAVVVGDSGDLGLGAAASTPDGLGDDGVGWALPADSTFPGPVDVVDPGADLCLEAGGRSEATCADQSWTITPSAEATPFPGYPLYDVTGSDGTELAPAFATWDPQSTVVLRPSTLWTPDDALTDPDPGPRPTPTTTPTPPAGDGSGSAVASAGQLAATGLPALPIGLTALAAAALAALGALLLVRRRSSTAPARQAAPGRRRSVGR